MEGVESKAEVQGQDSQIMSQNVEGFQQYVKEILNLVDQDEIYDSKKSKLRKLVTELSRMYGALADQHVKSVKEVSKNTHISTTPIKTQHVSSSYSTSPQVNQRRTTPNFMTPVGYDVTLNLSEGGFSLCRREGSESSFTSSSDSESTKKLLDSPKVKKNRVHDPDVLLKKISNFEKEQLSLKKKIQDLTDENALLEAEKANAAELKLMISESNRKIEIMKKTLEGSRKQVLAAEGENLELQQDFSSKVFDVTHRLRKLGFLDKLGSTGEKIDLLEKQFDEEEARNPKLTEQVALGLAEIAKRDEQIKELNTQIDLLKNSHAAEEDKWNSDIERLRSELREKCELIDDPNQKHDAVMSYTDELKLKVEEWEREVMSEDSV